jgi:alkylated DNA repair dioxygenase AlkB
MTRMNKELKENGYVVVEKFISKKQAKNLAESYKKFAYDNNIKGDLQIPNSKACYNHISFFELLCDKTHHVSKLLGESVLPTYAYSRVYGNGDELKRHRDRDSCEISLTLNLSQTDPWPIFFQKPDGTESFVVLNPGDAALYLGCDADHWRTPYAGRELVQVFLHYVRSGGERARFAFDNRGGFAFNQTQQVIQGLDKYVMYIEDLVPASLCDAILNEYKNDEDWHQSIIGERGEENPEIRGAKTISMSRDQTIGKNIVVRKELDQKLFECASKAINKYRELFSECVISIDTGYELLRYDTGFGYSRHTDDFKLEPRVISCSFVLNDEYTGGEFNLLDQNLSFKQKKGSVLMFPSNFMFPHEVAKVTSGTRYSIVTWFR